MKIYRTNNKVVVDYGCKDFQPCWTCKNACGGCSWSRDFEPVKGWEAIPHRIAENGKFADTYNIINCPEYIPDRRYGSNK